MRVLKRDGRRELVDTQKIVVRIKNLSHGLSDSLNPDLVVEAVRRGIFDGVTTVELDNLAAEAAAGFTARHNDYSFLAARISVSNLHKQTNPSLFSTVQRLVERADPTVISDDFWGFVQKHREVLDEALVHSRDFDYDYFGWKTLCNKYLLAIDGVIVERPQHLLMRVACSIHLDDVRSALETYDLLSKRIFTHASPTLFNAGTRHAQMSSCFLLPIAQDSIVGIYDTLKQCALISKFSGGIGLAVQGVRASGAKIHGTGGESNGLVPMLRVFNNTARYVDQGGGKRKGGFAVYLEPWHADVYDFVALRRNTGSEEMRTRDLFLGLWTSDLFMQRVEQDETWSLMSPDICPRLDTTWGEEHATLYKEYEAKKMFVRQVKARDLWAEIIRSQSETGMPYMMYKDHANGKSNQRHLGTIRCSNLCTEIIQYSSPTEVAVCNLASIALPMFVDAKNKSFDFDELARVVKIVTRNLDKVIDRNHYPLDEAKTSNMKHRPIGLGVQGLADAFMMLHMAFDGERARALNAHIFETIYFAALEASSELAKEKGTHSSFAGSPASKGELQFDLWDKPRVARRISETQWSELRERVRTVGLRNSLLVAPMPTASTAQILGNNECFEPYTSNLMVRRTLAGEFICVNKHLVSDLTELKLWNEDMRHSILRGNGSIQHMDVIPSHIRNLYKTAWELKGKCLIDLAADRGRYIDQSQSLNAFMVDPTPAKLTSMHFYAWQQGLKTGMYYLRTQAATDAVKITLDPPKLTCSRKRKRDPGSSQDAVADCDACSG